MIWEYSEGVPRKINVLCDNALLTGYALGQKTIGASVIEEAIRDLNWSPFSHSGQAQAAATVHPVPRSQAKTSHSRLATAASYVFAACSIVLVGLVLRMSGLNLQGSGLPPVSTSDRAGIPKELSVFNRSPVLRQPVSHEQPATPHEGARVTLAHETVETADGTVPEPADGQGAFAPGSTEIQDQEPMVIWESSPNEMGESQTREARVVVAKKGDNLSRIIFQTYGRYNRTVLGTVLQENPEIQDPDRITVGQAIRLPEQQ